MPSQFLFVLFNVANSYLDAYRILRHKTIAHGLNLTLYLVYCITLFFVIRKPELSLSGFPYYCFLLYLVSAFLNRQLSFDIPLNLRRGLKWYYVSLDNPPKAILDRIEVKLFGYDGKFIVYTYSFLYAKTLLFLWLL